jgi:hypothetical protein
MHDDKESKEPSTSDEELAAKHGSAEQAQNESQARADDAPNAQGRDGDASPSKESSTKD